MKAWCVILLSLLLSACAAQMQTDLRGTGDLGVIIERASGSVLIVETTGQSILGRVEGLGDLSHASIVFSRDARFAYVFGRDGGLTRIDLLTRSIDKRVIQGGNSIGGAISQDGRYVAVSNYEPGGVKIFDANTLDLIHDIPAVGADGKQGKTVGLVDAPNQQFVVSLFDSNEIWLLDLSGGDLAIQKYPNIGRQPYDALMMPNGRYYIAGLFGEDGMAKLDLWHPEQGVERVLDRYGKGEEKLPVYKMPHLEGWTVAGNHAYVPAVGRHSVLVLDLTTWQQVDEIPVHSQPVFIVSRPDGREAWVNFAYPDNDMLQVIDTETRDIVATEKAGKAVLHMEFTPRGEDIWVSIRDDNQVCIYDAHTRKREKCLPAQSPSGIFFTSRAHRIGY